jgi:hypothetical protein
MHRCSRWSAPEVLYAICVWGDALIHPGNHGHPPVDGVLVRRERSGPEVR